MENVKSGDEEEEKKGKDKGKLEGGKKKEKEEEEKSSRKGGQTRNNTKTDGDLQITKVSRLGVPPDLARQFFSRHLCTAFFFLIFLMSLQKSKKENSKMNKSFIPVSVL